MLRRNKSTARAAATNPATAVSPGTGAPNFAFAGITGEGVSLGDFRGQPLVFYPTDLSLVCSDQLALYNKVLPLFEEHNWMYVSPIGVNPGADGIPNSLASLQTEKD